MSDAFTPVGADIPIPGGHLVADAPRGIAADYLSIELGREDEATILRSTAQVAVEKGRVIVSLSLFLRRLDTFRRWLDSAVDPSLPDAEAPSEIVYPPELRGIGWHPGGAGFVGYLPNPEKGCGTRFVIEATEHEFANTFAAAIAEWVGRFRPDLEHHPELSDQLAALTA